MLKKTLRVNFVRLQDEREAVTELCRQNETLANMIKFPMAGKKKEFLLWVSLHDSMCNIHFIANSTYT